MARWVEPQRSEPRSLPGADVYWTQGDSAIDTAPSAGAGTPSKYLVGTPGVDQPGRLARDAKAIYWVDKSNGAVRKVALK